MDLKVLKCGNCEELKLGVHALALAVAALCGAYNAAAWLSRRERHLAVNTMMYAALMAFEQQHVSHHIAELRRPAAPPSAAGPSACEAPPLATIAEGTIAA
ncbi:MAG: hypothetical protein ACRD2I_00045 [Vicinamibacterales bacterium]